ncbi:hypothetical protein VOLCADRAFT_85766 [Volvox carteri f. nagariensis]|uniref:Uncharacterized protein n=1 Tax=Volvox carteri f. nagariensis TaxID=3068 RepID=D8TGX5_VOLCA|nr:uncharacterized protein VOLCADRAFT_85766 [Volvox carteri f. nagariensis]EFJ52609.1 hypothetical protein VOLCADRAFT_85766 [Volvox carteri f. nagariensis]|eukprot:XP_002945614.1 hypothetical protein VOLCADRAFT_85766 [Volvox carteri f. nagariensis]
MRNEPPSSSLDRFSTQRLRATCRVSQTSPQSLQVTAASSSTMVLFSSSAALIQFILLHRLNTDYAIVFGAASLVAGLLGTQAVSRAIKRSGRPSVVVLALAGVIGIATLCVAIFGLRNAAVQLRAGELGFLGICKR